MDRPIDHVYRLECGNTLRVRHMENNSFLEADFKARKEKSRVKAESRPYYLKVKENFNKKSGRN